MRALVADDHPLYLDAAQTHLVRHFPDTEIVTARSYPETLQCLAADGNFDIVLLDFNMPGMNGAEGIGRVVASSSAPVVVMSGMATHETASCCIAAGAKGFLPKTLDAPVFAAAINMILIGGTFIPAEFVGATPSPAEGTAPAISLTARELNVLELIVTGASNKEIARKLDIQEVTVKLYATKVFAKLGVKNRSQAAVKALQERLLQR